MAQPIGWGDSSSWDMSSNWDTGSNPKGGSSTSGQLIPQKQTTAVVTHPDDNSWERSDRSSDWGNSNWGVVPVSNLPDSTTLSQGGRTFLANASQKGSLSTQADEKDHQLVQKSLNAMIDTNQVNLNTITDIIKMFVEEVKKANSKIGLYCAKIIDRGIANDPTLNKGELDKANAIVEFTGKSVTVMNETSTSSLHLVEKGSEIISRQTQGAIAVIFETRLKQVQLFSQKIDIFHKQEKHELAMILQIQEAKMKEQEQLFTQLKEIAQFKEAQKESASKRDHEKKKMELERSIQLGSLRLKEEEQNNQFSLLQAEQEIKKQQEDARIKNSHALETKKVENTHAAAIHQTNVQGDVAKHQASQQAKTAIYKANKEAEASMHQADKQADAQNLKTITEALKPPCAVM